MVDIPPPPFKMWGDNRTATTNSIGTGGPPSSRGTQQRVLLRVQLVKKDFDPDAKKLKLVFSPVDEGTSFDLHLQSPSKAIWGGLDFLNNASIGQFFLIDIVSRSGKEPILLRAKRLVDGRLVVTALKFLNHRVDLLAVLNPKNPRQAVPILEDGFRYQVTVDEALGILKEQALEMPWSYRHRPFLAIRLMVNGGKGGFEQPPLEVLAETIEALGLKGCLGAVYEEVKGNCLSWVGVFLLTEKQSAPLLTPDDVAFYWPPDAPERTIFELQKTVVLNRPERPKTSQKTAADKPDVA